MHTMCPTIRHNTTRNNLNNPEPSLPSQRATGSPSSSGLGGSLKLYRAWSFFVYLSQESFSRSYCGLPRRWSSLLCVGCVRSLSNFAGISR